MSEISSSAASGIKPPKTPADYSRNVKKLKVKLAHIQETIADLQKKVKAYTDTSNDKMIALKISKFCKERRMTPEMLFRFADKYRKKVVTGSDFQTTLSSLGIKLTKHEVTRLEYLLDEDLSGDISWSEYNSYLHAFGIKGEYSANDQFLKDILKKLDINKIIAMSDENKDRDPSKRKRQLLNYEQFLKYCHRHMPDLKDKEIAGIFNRLEKNGMIDLEDFLEYMKRKEEERKKIEDKNKKKKANIDSIQQEETKTLKGIIKALLKNRPKDSKSSFHASEFQRLERILNKDKGEMLQLFRQIDKRKVGSFGFNELIQYYVHRELKGYLGYSYELMGRKMVILGHKPEDMINIYNGCRNKITKAEFIKFMKEEFGVVEAEAAVVFSIVAKEEQVTTVRQIIDAMKLEEGQKKVVYVKPTTWKTEGKDYFKKNHLTMLLNPFVALRFCISISEELNKNKQTHWDDFEFGPTFQDPFGSFSLGVDIPSENVKWNSTSSLGMNEFFFPIPGKKYKSTVMCPHDMFCKSLELMVNESLDYLWSRDKTDYNVKQVNPEHLEHIFHGMYPLAFHSFAQIGLYVFKFFVRERWVYVLVDNKIPCNVEDQPLFSSSANGQNSWVSLIQKAYAKVKGSYQRMFEVHSTSQYLFELTRKLPIEVSLPKQYKNEETKNAVWKKIQKFQQNPKNQLYSLTSDEAVQQLRQSNTDTGLSKNMMYPLEESLELKDKECNNSHKSHRLLLFRDLPVKNQNVWNPSWNLVETKNKYSKFQEEIRKQLQEKKSTLSLQQNKNFSIINFKLFRNIFDKLFAIKSVSFEDMIILRKVVEFEQKHSCIYELSSKEENNGKVSMIVTLLMLKSPMKAVIELKLKNSKKQVVHEEKIKGMYGCCQFQFDSDLHTLELKVLNWEEKQDHAYSLTFYMESPRYHMKELDRQLLFKFVSPLQEAHLLSMKECDDKEKMFIFRNFYRAAERGSGCCC